MAQPFPLAEQAPARRGRGAMITGLVLLGIGLVLAAIGIVGLGSTASSLIGGLGSPQQTPVELPKVLDAGTTYAVYELATSGTGTTEDPYLGNVAPGDVTVQAPDGSSLPVTDAPRFGPTFADGRKTYVVVATFEPLVSGTHIVSISTEGSTVVVAPSVTALAKALPWLGLIGFGGFLVVVGLVVLIVGLVRRGSKHAVAAAYPGPADGGPGYADPASAYPGPADPGTAAAPTTPATAYPAPTPPPSSPVPTPPPAAQPVLPPPGWYPDPERPGGQRYWNGTGWTEHRA